MKTTTLNIINMKQVYIGAWTSPYLLSKLGLHVSDEPCCFKIKGATEIFIHQGETKSHFENFKILKFHLTSEIFLLYKCIC